MKNITHTSPRDWYHQNEETINDLGFYIVRGDGDNIGLGHDELNNEIDFYWDEDGDPWTISTLYDGEEVLDEEVETEEDVIEVLKYIAENIEMFNCDEEYEEEDED